MSRGGFRPPRVRVSRDVARYRHGVGRASTQRAAGAVGRAAGGKSGRL